MIKKLSWGLVIFLNCFFCFRAGRKLQHFIAHLKYKASWQALLLQLSQAFNTAAKENQVDLDSSLFPAPFPWPEPPASDCEG